MACKRCGLCCIHCDILHQEITPESATMLTDRMRWFVLHRCDAQIVSLEDGRKFAMARIPLTCRNLDKNKDGFFCKDYKNRPQLCKDFMCDAAKEEKAK